MRNKKVSHTILFSLSVISVAVMGILVFSPLLAEPAFAQGPTLTPTGFVKECQKGGTLADGTPVGGTLAGCIKGIYLLSLGLGALLALLMIVLSGYRYMTSQGNAQQVEGAKEGFTSAFIGLIIIFAAFAILYVINPDLTSFSDLPLPAIPR